MHMDTTTDTNPAPKSLRQNIKDAIDAVRESGLTNMLDMRAVGEIAEMCEMDEDASEWLRDTRKNGKAYARWLMSKDDRLLPPEEG